MANFSTSSTFVALLQEFLVKLVKRFPENKGLENAKQTVAMMSLQSTMHGMISKKWYDFCNPIAAAVAARDTVTVCKAFDDFDNEIIKNMNISEVFQDPALDEETRESVWRYLQNLSVVATTVHGEGGAASGSSSTVVAPTPISPPTLSPAVAAPPAAKKPEMNDVVKGITTAMPQVMAAFNDMLKDDKGDNPMGQMLKQMMNPDQQQSGMFANMAASAMDNTPETVMEQAGEVAGLTKNQIIYKLERLKILEAREAKRKAGGRTRKHKAHN